LSDGFHYLSDENKKATTITGSRSYLYMSNLYFLTVAFT
jgi:hypothetical protein